MRAKDYLKQLQKLDKMIENKQAEIRQWKAMAYGITPQSQGERVQSSGSQQKMADAIGRYIDIEAEICHCIDELIDTKKDVISIIEQLNATEYDIIHKIYVQYLTFDEVAYSCQKSKSWATTVHGRALKHVQDILDKREK